MEEEAVAVGAAGLAMLEMEMEEELEAVLAEAVGLAEAAAAMHAPPAPPHRAAPGRTAATPPLSGGGAGIQESPEIQPPASLNHVVVLLGPRSGGDPRATGDPATCELREVVVLGRGA
ncbi:unnamed protein product [Miscanthus lutarioriparius]|uniref:Uncharacterized protein n=1 Tax=Miscanthus lutarioriparius TaxID=422564 RepID=A0A811R6M7_9POAL|nr:unnamed protein product [Miscanthus lutarioriparius]